MMDADFGFPTKKEKHGIAFCKKGKEKYENNCNEFKEDDTNIFTSGRDNCYNCKYR